MFTTHTTPTKNNTTVVGRVYDVIAIRLGRHCDMIVTSLQSPKLVDFEIGHTNIFEHNFRKRLFYLDKCVYSQFYYLLSYNRHYL